MWGSCRDQFEDNDFCTIEIVKNNSRWAIIRKLCLMFALIKLVNNFRPVLLVIKCIVISLEKLLTNNIIFGYRFILLLYDCACFNAINGNDTKFTISFNYFTCFCVFIFMEINCNASNLSWIARHINFSNDDLAATKKNWSASVIFDTKLSLNYTLIIREILKKID